MNCLKSKTRVVYRMYIRNQNDAKDYLDYCRARRVEVKPSSLHELNRLAGDRPHQNVVLQVSPFPVKTVKKLGFVLNDTQRWFVEGIVSQKDVFQIPLVHCQPKEDAQKPQPIVVCLDQVVDPQNLGAILRSCYFFGVDAVVMTDRDTAPLSAAVSRSSGGALELMSCIYSTPNLSSFLNHSKEAGWRVFGTDLKGKHVIKAGYDRCLQTAAPSILVLGNEGAGLSKGVSECCDSHLIIPGWTLDATERLQAEVDSLNVGVAAGILLHCLVKERHVQTLEECDL